MGIQSDWEEGVEGSFRVNKAITAVLPKGTRIISAESSGVSAWSSIVKVEAVLQDGSSKNYFLKVTTGPNGRGLAEGEYVSARAINDVVPGFGPEPTGWGVYNDGIEDIHFFIGDFHDLDLATAPDPVELIEKLVDLHLKGAVPGGKYGWDVATGFGKMKRTPHWEDTWAKGFTRQLQDVIDMDNDTNGRDAKLDAARQQLIDGVIPRLLGVLESDGRSIEPTLVHGDIWERNCGIDLDTGKIVIFDPGCTYAHNEMEFGTWRCTWAYHFASPVYMQLYKNQIEASEPAEEFDDRNRLYSMFPYLNNSGGRPGSYSRVIAHNDMLYLIEKYAPWDSEDRYDPKKDPKVPGSQISATTFMDE